MADKTQRTEHTKPPHTLDCQRRYDNVGVSLETSHANCDCPCHQRFGGDEKRVKDAVESATCTSQYHRPDALYCLDCLPADAPLRALLVGTRPPTAEEIKRGLALAHGSGTNSLSTKDFVAACEAQGVKLWSPVAAAPLPKRIQRKRTRGWKMPANTVYVGRPSLFGNPFSGGLWRELEMELMIKLYRNLFYGWDPTIVAAFTDDWVHLVYESHTEFINRFYRKNPLEYAGSQLRGKDLACWCKEGKPCHADVLLEIANG